MDNTQKQLDIETMREKLANVSGKRYWRGIEELTETPEFQSWLDDEFPQRASLPDVDRRSFLKLMGASLALAGLAGCRSLPEERIVPYVKAPEERLPGETLQYATAMPFGGYGFGLLVTSNEGRPIKIEGNPDHPASLGSSDIFAQAELLQMYDPDRSGVPMKDGYPTTWEESIAALRLILNDAKASGGAGLVVLTETVTSPTLYAQIQELLKAFPQAQWHQFEPVNRDNERAGSGLAFGRFVDTHYKLAGAQVVLSLDGDILGCTPDHVRHTRDFMANRDPDSPSMNRLYAIESTLTTTGAFADHRLAVKPSEIEGIAGAIAAAVGASGGPGNLPTGVKPQWIQALAGDLMAHKGTSLVSTSERQPAHVHALVHSINQALGNVGSTVVYTETVEPKPVIQYEDLKALTDAVNSDRVDTLLILGGNPVAYAPGDINFGGALKKLSANKKHTVHLSIYEDETSALCEWHLPESHFLEAWGDIRSYDGTTSIVQPLIAPLFDTRCVSEVLSDLIGKPSSDHALVQATWSSRLPGQAWRDALNAGIIPNSAMPAATVPAPTVGPGSTGFRGGAIEAVFAPDPTIHDGRYNNNGWLQELPKPLTKMSWDNAVIIGPKLAASLNVSYEDNVEVSVGNVKVTAPVYVLPGTPDDTVTLHIGYGRELPGKVGTGTGFNFNVLRSSKSPWIGSVELKKANGSVGLAMSQTHHSMDGRDIVREGDLEEYRKDPTLTPEDSIDDPNAILYNLSDQWRSENPDLAQWGMTIDLNVCTGCNACTAACQAENNIPTVGKDQVQRGRIMHWIRVDRYFRVEGAGKERDFHEPIAEVETISVETDAGAMNPDNIKVLCMPVPCMHCETAPCEPVCPVAATIHSHEGLNQMVYNRCVGTRYCSNNCPYKVRRFNFYNYQFRQKQFESDKDITLLNLLNNPDVSVRSRGVMEKCTYCVQRINGARITAKKENRRIKDGEIVTACQQACPSKAITFGDISDPTAAVTKLKALKRNYSLLADLNTRPRTTYLARVRNINKEIPV